MSDSENTASKQRIYDRCLVRVGQLEEENCKLEEKASRLFDKTLELADENKQLRDLLCAAWNCIYSGPSCYDCRLVAGGCTLQSAMRELGIKVGVGK